MGYVVIMSLPMALVLVGLIFYCYYYGKQKGVAEGRMLAAQELGMVDYQQQLEAGVAVPPPASYGVPPQQPPPPPPAQYFPSPTQYNPNPYPQQPYIKQEHPDGK